MTAEKWGVVRNVITRGIDAKICRVLEGDQRRRTRGEDGPTSRTVFKLEILQRRDVYCQRECDLRNQVGAGSEAGAAQRQTPRGRAGISGCNFCRLHGGYSGGQPVLVPFSKAAGT